MTKSYTLIISEKPQAALRTATALAEGKVKKYSKKGAYWLEFTRSNKKIIVVPAVGHLFVLNTIRGEGWNYPEFDTEWVPTFSKKGSEFTKKYYENIKHLVKNAESFIIATDYDTEGEVIGYNILRFLCKQKDAKRMKFSTLVKDDLVEAYENVVEHIDFGQAEAGLTRHYLDFHWGINTTRALTLAMKEFMKNAFVVVSSGRVQSPTLKLLTDKEIEIKKFVPVPYWQLILTWLHDGKGIEAVYEEERIWKKDKALKVLEECKNKDAKVKDLEKKTHKVLPPLPLNTTTLQTEAFRCFGFSPRQTMSVAEALYNQALISYPRTASQKLPTKIGYKKILQGLSKIKEFKEISKELLSKPLKPREGKRTDPAHVAIYPTGEKPKGLTNQQKNLYMMIVKRFFSVFGEPAVRESTKVTLIVNKHIFVSSGVKTISPGWLRYYGEFVRMEDELLPELKKGQTVDIKDLKMEEKETQPPKRYSQASIIKEMEKLGLGTRATRAGILHTLYNRGYVEGKSIEVTDFGREVIEILDEHCPRIVSVEMTRKFEQEMELVEEGKKRRKEVIEASKTVLIEILEDFKKNQSKIGKSLSKAYISFKREQKFIGKCPDCKGDLRIITSRRTGKRFVGCSNYEKGCRFSTPLPQSGSIKGLNKPCDICGFPLIAVRFRRKWFTSCTNMKCPSKEKQK